MKGALLVSLKIKDGEFVNFDEVQKICRQNGAENKLAFGVTGGNPFVEVLGWYIEIEGGEISWKTDLGEEKSVPLQDGELSLESELESDGENFLARRGYFEPKKSSD